MKKKKEKHQSERSTKDKRGAKTERSRLTNRQIIEAVSHMFASEPTRIFTYKQVCQLFGSTTMAEKRQIVSILEEQALFGALEEVEFGRYRSGGKAQKRINELEGTFSFRANRCFFISDDETKEPIQLSNAEAGQALHGDRVRIRRLYGRNRASRGEVVEILERKNSRYVGTIEIVRGRAFFISEHRELRIDLLIPEEDLQGARHGDKVVVEVVSWSKRDKNPKGKVLEVLGQAGDNNVEMHAILAEFGLPYQYPEEIEKAAEQFEGIITATELAKREDFREVLTFTIDPKDAKDFDDALSFRELPTGHYEIGVHIADVSHYVQAGDLIDREAYQRSTSVYLVDRTIPMLPERLSNYLCSLRPNEEKYSYSCIFEMNDRAEVVSYRIGRTIICSDRRFTYEEAQEIIEQESGSYAPVILKLNELAQTMRQRRFRQGSIAFERAEVRFEIDETGKPISVYLKESKQAHQLIEEFMLLANRTVAEHIQSLKKNGKTPPFVYRVHDSPDPDKLQQLSDFVLRFGYQLHTQGGERRIGESLNALLGTSKGKAEETLISIVAIRTMAKARYTTENIGHYGLAFNDYTHFTSPIRRYSDLMVHRLLTEYLVERKFAQQEREMEQQCKHISEMELVAAQAERMSIKYKQVEYMQDRLGEVYDGIISGLADWGIYVELEETKCEGLVPMRDLDDDYYDYDEVNYQIVGRRSGRRYCLGDRVRVQVAAANLERRQLDFALV